MGTKKYLGYEKLGEGKHSIVVSKEPQIAVKIPIDNYGRRRLPYELKIMEDLSEKGFPIPVPIGIKELTSHSLISRLFGLNPTGLFMERLSGIRGDRTNPYIQEKIVKFLIEQEKKAKSQGFKPRDISLENSIYNPSTQEISILDVADWELK